MSGEYLCYSVPPTPSAHWSKQRQIASMIRFSAYYKSARRLLQVSKIRSRVVFLIAFTTRKVGCSSAYGPLGFTDISR